MDNLSPLYQKTLKTLEFDKVLARASEYAATVEGKERLLGAVPADNLAEAERLQKETTEAKGMLLRRGSPAFEGVKPVLGPLHRAKIGSILAPGELLDVARLLKAARGLSQYQKEEEDWPKEALDGLFLSLRPNRTLEEKIFSAILSPEEMADGASPKLSDIRRKIRQGNEKVRETLNKIIHSSAYQKYLQEPIVTIRDGRLCLPVRQEFRAEIPGLLHDTSASGATLFIEPMAAVEANNELRVLQSAEKAEIERILAEFSAEVGDFSEPLAESYRAILELDVIFARAKFSREGGCYEPRLNSEGKIDLKKARHPLIAKEKVVPIDVRLGKDFDTLVVTGPNTGGKTVTLKTLGLFSAMAAAGFHLFAAEGSEAGVFADIFADIGDEQSIEQSLSTFSSHMKNIVEITKHLGQNTLVLFDELGAGTDPAEGAALAVAILEWVRKSGARCAATTHYSELKLFALSTPGVENGSCEFDVESLMPTYRLLIGIPGKSNAFAISRRLGLSDTVIGEAKSRLSSENVAFEDILSDLEKKRQAMEEHLQEAEALRVEAKKEKEEMAAKRSQYEKTRDQAIDQARGEARRIVSQAKYAFEQANEEIAKMRREALRENSAQRLDEARETVRGLLKEAEKEAGTPGALPVGRGDPNAKYAVGDAVQILNLNKTATVLTQPDKEGNLFVQAGIIRLSVNKRDIRKAQAPQKPAQAGGVKSTGGRAAAAVKTEVDLRGQDSEEAIFNLDQYLDGAVIAGLNTVTVIHGKGTGVLRAAVWAHLKNHPQIKSFRPGRYGEGEMGVTVVELK